MTLYRIYWVEAGDRYYRLADSVECATDEDAKTKAGTLINGYAAIEVWESTRLVARIDEATPRE